MTIKIMTIVTILSIHSLHSADCFSCLRILLCQSKKTGRPEIDTLYGQLMIDPRRTAYVAQKGDDELRQLLRNTNYECSRYPQVMIPIQAFSGLKNGRFQVWSKGHDALEDGNEGKRFVDYLPYSILKKLKEGKELTLEWNNKKVHLTCSQKGCLVDAPSFHAQAKRLYDNWQTVLDLSESE